jgi:hypothetical protein
MIAGPVTVFVVIGLAAIGFALVHPIAERARRLDYVKGATR